MPCVRPAPVPISARGAANSKRSAESCHPWQALWRGTNTLSVSADALDEALGMEAIIGAP